MPSSLMVLSTLLAAVQAQDLVAGFLPPKIGLIAAACDMFPSRENMTLQQCADWCTSTSGCISFNYCSPNDCGIQTWSPSYNPQGASACSWYRRSLPRNDTPAPRAVSWLLDIPAPGTVSLLGGPIAGAFTGNLNDYLKLRDPLDMLYFFNMRATGNSTPPGQCFGWDKWIKGSATGNYLMGAGSALQWTEDVQLRAGVEFVVAGIRQFQDPNSGWAWAWDEQDMVDNADNMPDYCASWVTRGLLDAARAGIPDALQLARDSISLFNNHTSLPWILPQNGGPNPVLPYPASFNNVTSGGYGQKAGHMIYIEYQGMIKHTLMALSPMGTQADVDIIEEQYQENWWLEALIAKDAYHAIWHRQFFSHNYEITAFEAFLDMYVLTGNTTYLTATLNAWEMLREHWILPGGSFALNEGSYYPPDSYYIGFTGTHVAAHQHDSAAAASSSTTAAASDDPYYHAPCMAGPGLDLPEGTPPLLSAAARQPPPSHEGASGVVAGPNDSDPPTGELCGSVFWALFNQRFHRLYPDNETFVGEIERSVLNVGLAALGREGSGGQGPGGRGIRYFANQHKVKQKPAMHASCCEGQGTRLFGSLPSFLFSLSAAAAAGGGGGDTSQGVRVNVDLYAESALTSFPVPPQCGGGQGRLEVHTQWPYASPVSINLTLPPTAATGPCPSLQLGLRMPAWLPGPAPVTINGVPSPSTPGTPGTYLVLTPAVSAATAASTLVQFSLPMAHASTLYSGSSQLPPYKRYSFLYGPVLLAAEGPWDGPSDSLVMPLGVDPTAPAQWMVPAGDGNALHFNVTGAPGVMFKPYWEVQDADERFSNYPCFH